MSQKQIQCSNCGAMMSPGHDGRTFACSYCGTQAQVAVDGEQIAAGLALDLADASAFLDQLAGTLTKGFPERVKVRHVEAKVVHLEINFDKDGFVAKHEDGTVVAMHRKMSRGIALKSVPRPLDEWFEALTSALAAHANASAHAQQAFALLHGARRR